MEDGDVKPPKVRRLEVPKEILNMFKEKEESDNDLKDNACDHEGRIRSFPHARGNWASHVYIPCMGEDMDAVESMIELIENVWNVEEPKVQLFSSVHLSLSKTVVFRHHWIEPFIQELKQKLSSVKRFYCVYEDFDVLLNDEKTRTFIVMKISPSEQLRDLVNICDNVLKQYKLDSYYKEPAFHISLAWVLGDHLEKAKECLPMLKKEWKSLLETDESLRTFCASSVEFKYGHKVSTFNL